MDIQSLGILNDAMIQGNTITVKNAENNFRQLFEKITGGELAREIRDNYDVTLNVGNVVNCDQFLETNDLRGTNHVIISPLCGVPIFISGNGQSGNQKIAQAASSQAF